MEEIAVIFGGKSVEHDISVITGIQTIRFLKENYKCLPIYIDGNGTWWTGKNLDNPKIYQDFFKRAKSLKKITPIFGGGAFKVGLKRKKVYSCVVCCHGLNGEDGSVAGVLELCNLPYTSCGILSSSVCMDKAFTKAILANSNLKTTNYKVVFGWELEKSSNILSSILEDLKFPLIVKPANLGSSVGISVCNTKEELIKATEIALHFDSKVLIEEFLKGCEEFNCACFSYNDKVFTSDVCVVNKGEIFSFDDKYIKQSDFSNEEISNYLKQEIKNATQDVYKMFECFGVVRVDFLWKDGELFVNEINTIPGALSCYLFPNRFKEVLDIMIEQSRKRLKEKEKISYSFKSDALKLFENSAEVFKK